MGQVMSNKQKMEKLSTGHNSRTERKRERQHVGTSKRGKPLHSNPFLPDAE